MYLGNKTKLVLRYSRISKTKKTHIYKSIYYFMPLIGFINASTSDISAQIIFIFIFSLTNMTKSLDMPDLISALR